MLELWKYRKRIEVVKLESGIQIQIEEFTILQEFEFAALSSSSIPEHVMLSYFFPALCNLTVSSVDLSDIDYAIKEVNKPVEFEKEEMSGSVMLSFDEVLISFTNGNPEKVLQVANTFTRNQLFYWHYVNCLYSHKIYSKEDSGNARGLMNSIDVKGRREKNTLGTRNAPPPPKKKGGEII